MIVETSATRSPRTTVKTAGHEGRDEATNGN
jgi:hypothetical protein